MKNYFSKPLGLSELVDHSNPMPRDMRKDSHSIDGCQSLSRMIRIQRAGGVAVKVRQLSDSDYDEDDSTVVDPSIDNLDKFERAQALSDQISYRMRKQKEDKLKNLEV